MTAFGQFQSSNYFLAPPDGSEFDFVVVGSGSAGSVVTRRLAEAGHRYIRQTIPINYCSNSNFFLKCPPDRGRRPLPLAGRRSRRGPLLHGVKLRLEVLPGAVGEGEEEMQEQQFLKYYLFHQSGLAMEGGRVKKPRGRVLGGSSMLNWMLHVRGHSKDYDEWDDMLGGNKGWTYK